MTALVPNRFLFSFEFPLRYRPDPPELDGRLTGWTDNERLPMLGAMEGRPDFADAWACWNEDGVYVACRVAGKKKALSCDPARFWSGDNFRLCIDTRDARSNKRATRYCHQFYFLPKGAGARRSDAVAGATRIQRAREDAPLAASNRLRVAATVTATGYELEGHIPADCLNGFNPADHPRIGFYYIVEDQDFGQQYLTVGDDLYWFVDPSTWATAVMAR